MDRCYRYIEEKMANIGGEGFIFTKHFYNNPKDSTILVARNNKPEGEAAIKPDTGYR